MCSLPANSRLLSVQPLVSNADAILASLKGVCGNSLVNAAVKRTLFSHFCAGTRVCWHSSVLFWSCEHCNLHQLSSQPAIWTSCSSIYYLSKVQWV